MTDEQIKKLLECRLDPVIYFKDILCVEDVEPYQADVGRSVRDNKKTGFRSAHGVGKTALAAWIVNWFIDCFPDSKVITTASSWRQVKKMLWPEIHKWRNKARLDKIGVYKWEKLDLGIKKGDDWFATGEASNDPLKMEGFHAPYILFVVDEGKAVPDATYEAIEGALSTGFTRLLVISTPPAQKAGFFYEIFSGKRLGYKKFHISGLDSKRVSKSWIEERKKEWGEDSTIYKNRVLGEFGDDDKDTVIQLAWVEQCIDNDINRERWAREGKVFSNADSQVLGGCDVARFGDDRTVKYLKKGFEVIEYDVNRKEDTMVTAGRIAKDFNDGVFHYNIDDIGVGGGVVDRLKELNLNVTGINVAESAKDNITFINKRAEVWWNVRELFRQDLIKIPDDEELIAELTTMKYKYSSNGRIQIESKDDVKKRTGKSPDKADAFCLAFYVDFDSDTGLIEFYKKQNEQQQPDKPSFKSLYFRTNI